MKKNISKLTILFSLLLVLSACSNKKVVYDEAIEMEGMVWSWDDELKYEVNIEDTSKYYDVFMTLSYHYDLATTNIKPNLTVIYPNTELRTSDYSFHLIDENGKRLGEVMGDYVDVEFPLKSGFKFSVPGTYTYQIINNYSKTKLPGIFEVGIKVVISEKSDKEK